MTSMTCGDCKRRRTTFPIGRQGGGSYNRAPRRYHSSICAECVLDRLPHAPLHAGASQGPYPVFSLADITARLANPANPGHTERAVRILDEYIERLRDADARDSRPWRALGIQRLLETAGRVAPETTTTRSAT